MVTARSENFQFLFFSLDILSVVFVFLDQYLTVCCSVTCCKAHNSLARALLVNVYNLKSSLMIPF